MSGVMDLNAFRQEALATAPPAARKDRATTFCLHASSETELAFPGAFAGLIRPFHKLGCVLSLRKRAPL